MGTSLSDLCVSRFLPFVFIAFWASDIFYVVNTLFHCMYVCVFSGSVEMEPEVSEGQSYFLSFELLSAYWNDFLGAYFKPTLFCLNTVFSSSLFLICQAPVHRSGLVSRRLTINFLTTAPLGTRPRGFAPGLIPRWLLSTQLKKKLSWPTLYARHCTLYQKNSSSFELISSECAIK